MGRNWLYCDRAWQKGTLKLNVNDTHFQNIQPKKEKGALLGTVGLKSCLEHRHCWRRRYDEYLPFIFAVGVNFLVFFPRKQGKSNIELSICDPQVGDEV